jgi:hypothetical protein
MIFKTRWIQESSVKKSRAAHEAPLIDLHKSFRPFEQSSRRAKTGSGAGGRAKKRPSSRLTIVTTNFGSSLVYHQKVLFRRGTIA